MKIPTKKDDHPIKGSSTKLERDISQKCKLTAAHLQAGMTCPYCHQAKLDYNGLLQLMCPRCGVVETGTFT